METLDRKNSQYVISLENPCKCCMCGKLISYSSLTYHQQTGNHIGLDCWEKEKAARQEKRRLEYEQKKEAQHEIDLKSKHVAELKARVTVTAKLERCIFLYTSHFGYTEQDVYLNIFRTDSGDILAYKGKSMYYDYLAKFGYDISEVIGMDMEERVDAHTKYNELYEELCVFQLHESNYDSMTERQKQYYSEVTTRDVTIIGNPRYIILVGTVKEHTYYNDVKQTIIQRPKIK